MTSEKRDELMQLIQERPLTSWEVMDLFEFRRRESAIRFIITTARMKEMVKEYGFRICSEPVEAEVEISKRALKHWQKSLTKEQRAAMSKETFENPIRQANRLYYATPRKPRPTSMEGKRDYLSEYYWEMGQEAKAKRKAAMKAKAAKRKAAKKKAAARKKKGE